jgi:two-component system, OmpR family, response regulator RstA
MLYDGAMAEPLPPTTRVLLVEDDAKLAALVREFLEASGFHVSVEPRGDHAVGRILGERPDLVILDLMLPGLDGLAICRQVRPHFDGAILMLTARGEETDEIVGLELGADDYLAKPVRPRRLLARVNTLLRRVERKNSIASTSTSLGTSAEGNSKPRRLTVGRLVVDAGNRLATMDSEVVDLTTAEFDLLWLLASHAGEVLSRDHIYRELRGMEYDGLDRSMDLRVARLRRKLGDDGKQPRLIKSVRGAGYLLVVGAP